VGQEALPRSELLATNSYSHEQCELIVSVLRSRWNLTASVIDDYGKGFKIDLNSNSSERFFSMVAPYVVGALRYKLPNYLRHVPCFWDGYTPSTDFDTLRKAKIISISARVPAWVHAHGGSRAKYDLEVADNHNYFVDDILVHNSNALLTSSGVAARNASTADHKSFDLLKAMHVPIKHLVPEGIQVFGEWLYARHSIHYSGELTLPSLFQVFAVYKRPTQMWLEWAKVQEWAAKLGFETVTVLSKIQEPNVQKLIYQLTRLGNSVIEKGHEGIVVRNTYPFHYGQFQSNIAKFVRLNHVTTDEHWSMRTIERNAYAKAWLRAPETENPF